MPLIDITNPNVIKFYTENYDKTARLRMKWNHLHSRQLQEAATLHREEKGYYETDVIQETMTANLATITRDHKVAANNRRLKVKRDMIPRISNLKKGHAVPTVGLGDVSEDFRLNRPDNDLSIDPVMRPVNPEQRNIIYKDYPSYGRKAYLKTRSKIVPEKKYYFPECSGWEYGWRLDDSNLKIQQPKFGRLCRLARDIKSRSGPHPDASHYISTAQPGPTKCNI